MKYILICLCFLTSGLFAQSKNAKVTDFKRDQRQGVVVVTYTLEAIRDQKLFNVQLKGTLNGNPLNIKSVDGTQDVTVGRNKELIWYLTRDNYSELQGVLGFDVVASNPNDRDMDGFIDGIDKCPDVSGPYEGCESPQLQSQPCLSLPATAGLGAVAAGGLALVLSGAKKASDVKNGEVYQLYQTNLSENDPVFTEAGYQNRQDAFDTINKEYRSGSILLFTGMAMIATAGTTWLIRKLNCNNRNDSEASIPYVTPRWEPLIGNIEGPTPLMGVGIRYQIYSSRK